MQNSSGKSHFRGYRTNQVYENFIQRISIKSTYVVWYKLRYFGLIDEFDNITNFQFATDLLFGHCSFIQRIVYGVFSFSYYDKGHTANLTGRQRMLTSPWHLILLLVFVEVRVCSAFVLYLSFGPWFWNIVRYDHISCLRKY